MKTWFDDDKRYGIQINRNLRRDVSFFNLIIHQIYSPSLPLTKNKCVLSDV